MSKQKTMKGFTLIEILVVVALIAILTAITFIAINPAKNFADTRNAQRSSDVVQILNGVTQYTSESGHMLADFGTLLACPLTSCIGTDTAVLKCIDLEPLLVDVTPNYIVGIPTDPLATAPTDDTGYTICTTGGRVQIAAPLAEGAKAGLIVVKR